MKAFVCFIVAAILMGLGILRAIREPGPGLLSSVLFGAAGAMATMAVLALTAIG